MASSTNSALGIIVGIGVVLAVVLLGAALAVGGFASTSSGSGEFSGPISTGPIEPPRDGSHGIVTGAHRSEAGFNLFGWQLTSGTHVAHVAVVPPPRCEAARMGSVEPEGDCEGIAAWGDVTGGGGPAGGPDFVIVAVEVDEACAEALEHGDEWPSGRDACDA